MLVANKYSRRESPLIAFFHCPFKDVKLIYCLHKYENILDQGRSKKKSDAHSSS